MKNEKLRITLLIDTVNNKEIVVGLKVNGKEYSMRQKIGLNKSQVVLSLMDKLLKEKKINIKDLVNINVNVDEGSFMGKRVGISIGKALSFALGIPVNFKKFNAILGT